MRKISWSYSMSYPADFWKSNQGLLLIVTFLEKKREREMFSTTYTLRIDAWLPYSIKNLKITLNWIHSCFVMQVHAALDIVDEMRGAGLTPSIQALHSILQISDETSKFNLVDQLSIHYSHGFSLVITSMLTTSSPLTTYIIEFRPLIWLLFELIVEIEKNCKAYEWICRYFTIEWLALIRLKFGIILMPTFL